MERAGQDGAYQVSAFGVLPAFVSQCPGQGAHAQLYGIRVVFVLRGDQLDTSWSPENLKKMFP